MDLHSGKYYWQTTLPTPPSYSALEEDIHCDVLIIGGGSSGAQCAHLLSETDLNVVVVEKRKIGTGSTIVNTALLQYLGDKMLFELVNTFGEEIAIRHTKLCEQAIRDIEKTSNTLSLDCEFFRRDSLYSASDLAGVEKLKKEYGFLHKHGFQIDLLTKSQINDLYPFQRDSALYIYQEGEINSFIFNHGLLLQAHQKGVKVFEDTKISGYKLTKESATFYTENGHSIQARFVIIASGYEGLEHKLEKNCVLSSSYAVVTNRVENFSDWYKRTLIWETARPYIYMRTTKDNRVIIGGLDDNTVYPEDRDSKIIAKKDKLIKEFNKLFPDIKVSPEYYFGAFYGGTHDGLPMIGEYDEFPNCYFLFAYGDNGLVYGNTLAKIITEVILNGTHPDINLYHTSRIKS